VTSCSVPNEPHEDLCTLSPPCNTTLKMISYVGSLTTLFNMSSCAHEVADCLSCIVAHFNLTTFVATVQNSIERVLSDRPRSKIIILPQEVPTDLHTCSAVQLPIITTTLTSVTPGLPTGHNRPKLEMPRKLTSLERDISSSLALS
jgi:hypothetical protein